MSDPSVLSGRRPALAGSRPGQSLVEFALVLPVLLVLLLGVADFARVFAAGITLEAAARDGAEAAAQEYVQRERNDPDPLTAADYEAIRTVALEVTCEEATVLPNFAGSGADCTMPVAAACVHDGGDVVGCGDASEYVPGNCPTLYEAWTTANEHPSPDALPYVEVRVCYQFTTIINMAHLELPFGWSLSLGEVWLQRDRSFAAGDY